MDLPDGVFSSRELDVEEIELDEMQPYPTWVGLCAGFGAMLSTLLGLHLLGSVGAAPPAQLTLGILGALTTVALAVRFGRFGSGRRVQSCIRLTPVTCEVDGTTHRWGELERIVLTEGDICFFTDRGFGRFAGLRGYSDDKKRWLVARLQARLEELAPGSPEDVPEELKALRSPTS